MQQHFVQILCCPVTRQSLQLKEAKYTEDGRIEEGKLVTDDGLHSYPIIRGVPRFVTSDLYSQSFSYEWKKWSKVQYESENVNKDWAQGFTENMFKQTTLFSD